MQVLFYVTPVLWPPKLLQGNEHLLTFNPFYYFLEILRTPMMGQAPSSEMWIVTSALTLLLIGAAIAVVTRYRWRVAYWI